MQRRLLITASTAAWICGLYSLYAFFVTPYVEPKLVRRVQAPLPSRDVSNRPLENMRLAEMYLAADPWTRKARYQLRLAEMFIYAEEWEREGDLAEIRFRPFAMIWLKPDSAPGELPVTIVSDSAVLRFADQFDMANPQPGRIVGGAMEGPVRIRGPEGLAIDGRNFIFAEESLKLWSDHPVALAYGPHKGSGHGLQMDLVAGDPTRSRDLPVIGGIQTITLRKKVAARLAGGWPTPGKEPKAGAPRPDDAPVLISSAGSFQYHVASQAMTFEDRVRVRRPSGPQQLDGLDCEELKLEFEPVWREQPAEETGGHEEPNVASWFPRELIFQRMFARGPADRPVVMTSPANQFRAESAELAYDANTRTIALRHPQAARAVQGPHTLKSAEIAVVHDAEGCMTALACRGVGRLDSVDLEHGAFSARWQDSLVSKKEPASGLDVIELTGAAEAELKGEMKLRGQRIVATLSPSADGTQARDGSPQLAGKSLPQADLEQLLAEKSVRIESARMNGNCERLEVRFEPEGPAPALQPAGHEIPAPPPDLTRPRPAPRGARLERSNLRPVMLVERRGRGNGALFAIPEAPVAEIPPQTEPEEEIVVPGVRITPRAPASLPSVDTLPLQPTPAAAPRRRNTMLRSAPHLSAPERTPVLRSVPRESSGAKSAPAEPPLELTAATISVRVVRRPDADPHPAEIWTEGTLVVTQARPDDQDPLRLEGARLHILNHSETDQQFELTGDPAHVRERGLHLEGRDIRLDRGRNRLTVHGAGLLQLPVKSTLDGQPLETPQLLDVWWREAMTFDGRLASFYEQVRTVLQDGELRCQTMHVTLSEKISFQDPQQRSDSQAGAVTGKAPSKKSAAPDLQKIDCRDDVSFEQKEYVERKLLNLRRGRVAQFQVDHQSGKLAAQGPGWMMQWERGGKNRAGLVPTAAVKSNKPLASENVAWEYTKVEFAGQVLGNLHERYTTFQDRVQIVYGPVERSTALVDPDDLPKHGGWMRSDSLSITHHSETEKQDSHVRMLANGNVELEGVLDEHGQAFNARADSVSYDESKGLYILRSLGAYTATIWRQAHRDAHRVPNSAQKMEFNPSRNEVRFFRTTGIEGLQ